MTRPPTVPEAEAALCQGLARLVEDDIVPGGACVLLLANRGVVFEHAFGSRTLLPEAEPATVDTLFDGASITKALVTAGACLRLAERGELDLAAPVSELVEEFRAASGPRAPTVDELLLHAAGLPAWEPLYAVAPGGLGARAAWLARHRIAPGHAAVYGCPGYQVIGLALERLTGRTLPELATALVLGREASDAFFPVPSAELGRCAATEVGNVFERDLAGARAQGHAAFRTGLIRGETHDLNAATLGGAAGNAGLFATARGVARLARPFLVAGEVFSTRTLADLSRSRSPSGGTGELRTRGFQLARSTSSAAGPALSDRAFGHVGFTGTSVFIDPDRGAVHVLLTNRVHPEWRPRAFNVDRAAVHALLAALAEAHGV